MVTIKDLEEEIQEKKQLLAEKQQTQHNRNNIERDFRNRVKSTLDKENAELKVTCSEEKRNKINENIDNLNACLTDSIRRDTEIQQEIEQLETDIINLTNKLENCTKEMVASISSQYKQSPSTSNNIVLFCQPRSEESLIEEAKAVCMQILRKK